MTTSRYIYDTLDMNLSVLRYWGDKPSSLLDILHNGTPVGWYVFEGKHSDALGPGFDIVDADSEILPSWEELEPSIIHDVVEKYKKARAEYNKKFCVLGMFDFDTGDGEELYFLTDDHIIDLDIKPGTKEITRLKFGSPIELSSDYSYRTPIEVSAMDKVRLMGDYDRRIGRFRSRYEAVVDNLTALSILDQQLTLLVIRVGSGVRRIEATEAILSDSDARSKLEDMLENWGMNSLLIVPVTSLDESGFRAVLDFGEGTPPINWAESRSNLLRGITIRTGIPQEVFDGAELGLRSSEKNHGKYLNTLHAEQRMMEQDLLWCFSHYIDIPEDASISWRPFVEPDEETMIEMFLNKMDALDRAMKVQQKTGMPLDWIKEQLKLDYDTDDQLLAEFEEMKQTLTNPLREGSDNDNQDDQEEPPGQEEEEPEEME